MQVLPIAMTSLPIMSALAETAADAHSALITANIGQSGEEHERFLLRAFRSFSEAAVSLERSYGQLQVEVARLRTQLEESNAGLALSLEENRRVRAHLDRILEALPCGVLVVSREGAITRANPEASRLLGLIQENLSRHSRISELPPALHDLFERAREGQAESEFAGGDGGNRWLSARCAPLASNDKDSSVFIVEEISERKRFEQAQQQLRREQALAEMSAVLAHEIRNPLGSMELFAGLLAEAPLDAESRAWVGHVQAGLRTLAATVNNVLQFHSLPQPQRALLDLGDLLDWAEGFVRPLAQQARVEVRLEHCLGGVTIPADRHRLEQVLLNLLLNAVHAMPGGGWIKITGREAGPDALLVIADTGPGISPDDLPKIFEPGFSRRGGSPGLGLTVCRKIIEQHGGNIFAESRPGAGAKFTVKLPLEQRGGGEQQ